MISPINYLIPQNVADQIAIFDQNYQQLFKLARIFKPFVKETAKGMENPDENGTILTDHIIIMPYEIELPMLIKAPDIQDIYGEIKQNFLNSTLLVVQTKTGTYPNMYILEMPHEEDPQQYDAVMLVLSMKQAQIVTPQTSTIQPKNPTNSSTVNRGTQQPGVPPFNTTADDIIGGL